MKILVIGATGMLGYSLFKRLIDQGEIEVYGTVRSIKGKEQFFTGIQDQLFKNVDVSDLSEVENVIKEVSPEVVINCIGLIKQHDISKQYVSAISINSLFPHQLATLCDQYSSKLIHFSTDCVFNGESGSYIESDTPNARDLYGRSKCLGEIEYKPHLTLRTSIIGHELTSSVSLVDWFLSQKGEVKGFSNAIFSGLPTCYIAELLVEKILPNYSLSGLYHLSVEPIDKFSLLELIAKKYNKEIKIIKFNEFKVDRSLNSENLREKISLEVPSWKDLISTMHNDYKKNYGVYR